MGPLTSLFLALFASLTLVVNTLARSHQYYDMADLEILAAEKNFKEFIPVTGNVLPIKTVFLDAVEGGQVKEIYVEDGEMVRKGQKLIKLSTHETAVKRISRSVGNSVRIGYAPGKQ